MCVVSTLLTAVRAVTYQIAESRLQHLVDNTNTVDSLRTDRSLSMKQIEPDTVHDVMKILGKPEEMFPTNQQIGDRSVEDVFGSKPDDESRELMGYLTVSVTGGGRSILVSHEKLVAKMDELGFPAQFIPSEPSSDRAFRRAKRELSSTLLEKTDFSFNESCKLNLRRGPEDGNVHHITANYFDSGETQIRDLGTISYYPDEQAVYPLSTMTYDEPELVAVWNAASDMITELFEQYNGSHMSDDIISLQETLREKAADHIRVRPAVYFYPATTIGFEHVLESFSQLYEWIDRNHKSRGKRAFFTYTYQFNQQRNRQRLAKNLRAELKSEMEELIETVAEKLVHETTAEELAENKLRPEFQRMDARLMRLASISEPTPCLQNILNETLVTMDEPAEKRARTVINKAGGLPGDCD